jgi:hypothetical protein
MTKTFKEYITAHSKTKLHKDSINTNRAEKKLVICYSWEKKGV